jgi:hypothetical protein
MSHHLQEPLVHLQWFAVVAEVHQKQLIALLLLQQPLPNLLDLNIVCSLHFSQEKLLTDLLQLLVIVAIFPIQSRAFIKYYLQNRRTLRRLWYVRRLKPMNPLTQREHVAQENR